MARSKLFKALVILSAALTVSAQATELTIHVTGLRSGHGRVAISIFSDQDRKSFPDQAHRASQTFDVELAGRTELTIAAKDLPEGRYSIALMHDEDGNGKFKTTAFGIPKEGFGFSNNPKVVFGAPNFEACALEFDGTAQETEIKAKYML